MAKALKPDDPVQFKNVVMVVTTTASRSRPCSTTTELRDLLVSNFNKRSRGHEDPSLIAAINKFVDWLRVIEKPGVLARFENACVFVMDPQANYIEFCLRRPEPAFHLEREEFTVNELREDEEQSERENGPEGEADPEVATGCLLCGTELGYEHTKRCQWHGTVLSGHCKN